MMRGCRIEATREDVLQGCPLAVDVDILGIDPGTTGDHADAFQLAASTHSNVIVYDVQATGLHDQGFFARSNGASDGLAIIDSTFELALPLRRIPGSAGNAIGGTWNHVVIRNSTFTNPYPDKNVSAGLSLWTENIGGVKRFALSNSIVEGCTFGSWAIGDAAKAGIPSGTFRNNVWAGVRKDGLP